jgi:tetratricopeptide (TPR) repeat protein
LGAAWIASAAKAAPEKVPPTDAQQVRELGDALFAQGQFQAALARFQIAWALNRAPLDLLRIGLCRYKLGEIVAAKDALFRFLQLDPTSEHAPEAFEIITEIEKAEAVAKARPVPEVLVDFASDPAGASVEVENELLCDATPCSKTVRQGQYLVAMQKEGYETTVAAFYANSGARVSLKLPRLEGQVSLTSEPSGMEAKLDGQPMGRTPLLLEKVLATAHEVAIEDACYQRAAQKFELKKDEKKSVNLVLRARETELKLQATDDAGMPVTGTALLGRQRLGNVPGTHRVSICAKSLTVESGKASIEQRLSLTDESAALTVQVPVGRCNWISRQNRIAGWTSAAGLLLGGGGMGGALAVQHSVLNAPAGASGLRSQANFGKALNVVGIVGIAVTGVGLAGLLLLPSSASACASTLP